MTKFKIKTYLLFQISKKKKLKKNFRILIDIIAKHVKLLQHAFYLFKICHKFMFLF